MWFCCQIWQCNFKTCFGPFEIWKVWNGWSHVVYPTKGNSAPDSFTNPGPIQEVQEVTSKKIRKQAENEEGADLSTAGLSALEPALTGVFHEMESTLCSPKEPQSSTELLSCQSSDSEESLNCPAEVFTDNEITVITFSANESKDEHDGVRIWKLRYKLEMEEKQFQREHRYFSSTASDERTAVEKDKEELDPVAHGIAQEASDAVQNAKLKKRLLSSHQNDQKPEQRTTADEHQVLSPESCRQKQTNQENQAGSDSSSSDERDGIGKQPIHWVEQLRSAGGQSSLENPWQCKSYPSLPTAESTDVEWHPLFEF